jgi:hypothetical protein
MLLAFQFAEGTAIRLFPEVVDTAAGLGMNNSTAAVP